MKDNSARQLLGHLVHHLGGEVDWKAETLKMPAITQENDHNQDIHTIKHDQEILYRLIEQLGENVGYDLQTKDGKLRWFRLLKGIDNL